MKNKTKLNNKLLSNVGKSCCIATGAVAGLPLGGIVGMGIGAILGALLGHVLERTVRNSPII